MKTIYSIILPFIVACTFEGSNGLTMQQVTVTGQRGDYTTAINHCKSLGLRLIRVQNEEENNLVHGLSVSRSIGRYWVDGNDMQREGVWVNSDNETLNFKKWHVREPNNFGNNENCAEVHFYGDQTWNDDICSTQKGIICFSDEVSSNPSITETVNIELMNLDGKTTYSKGISLCKALGLEMVKVDSDEMNRLVYDFAVQKGLGEYWIDLNDNQQEGSWVNFDGTKTSYRHFANGEPNGGRGENCVHGLFYKDAFWNDITCSRQCSVICFKIVSIQPARK